MSILSHRQQDFRSMNVFLCENAVQRVLQLEPNDIFLFRFGSSVRMSGKNEVEICSASTELVTSLLNE